jgi:predicted DNA-binding transcriptional regulator AlpA
MPTELHGRRFFSVGEVLADLGVSRQTLWRWREAGHVPRGHRFRNGQLLFDDDNVTALREFALRVEPLDAEPRQMALFANGQREAINPEPQAKVVRSTARPVTARDLAASATSTSRAKRR